MAVTTKGFNCFLKKVGFAALVVSFAVSSPLSTSHAQMDWLRDKIKNPPIKLPVPGGNSNRRSGEQSDDEKANKTTGNVIKGVLGIGGVFGYAKCKSSQKLRREMSFLCDLGALGGAYAVNTLGNAITQNLNEKDQKTALKTAGDSLKSGQPKTISLPDSNAVFTVTPEDQPVYKDKKSTILIDGEKVEEIPKLKGIGSTFQAASSVNVRSGPSTEHKVVASLKKDEYVHVMGEAMDGPWVLIARMVDNDGFFPSPVAYGYVHKDFLKDAGETEIEEIGQPSENIQSAQVDTVLKCQMNNNTIIKDNGEKVDGGSTFRCLDLNGLPTSV